MIHLLEVPQEVTGHWSPITSGLGGQMQCNTSKRFKVDRGGRLFQACKKHTSKLPTADCYIVLLVSLPGGRCPGVPCMPPESTSGTTSGTRTIG